ncbi:MAG: hypothetical protein ACI8RZ_000458 [Myxococcota bacterium]|jgi:hypothetical protein
MSLGRINTGRYEFKYAIPTSLCSRIVDIAGDHITSDPHGVRLPGGGLGYAVHSVYFDTVDADEQPALGDYFQRLCDHKIRDRLRVRTYGARGDADQPIFLENKRKRDNRVVKARVWICTADEWAEACTRTSTPWKEFAHRIKGRKKLAYNNFCMHLENRRPVSVVHYLREVFVDRDPDNPKVRLTIDRNVTATTRPPSMDPYAPATVDLIPRDWAVLELKFDENRPGWMRRLVRELRLCAVPISKFGLSVVLGYRADNPYEIRFFTPTPLLRIGALARPELYTNTTAAEAAS